jgi:hypothetical protein
MKKFAPPTLLCTPAVKGGLPCGGPLAPGDPPAIPCSGAATIPAGVITTSQTWPASCLIKLDGMVQVGAGVTIKIQPGTVIQGLKLPSVSPFSALVFRQDSHLDANGTAQCPIVFTSDQPVGSRSPGDWGGIMIDGRAPVNLPSPADPFLNPYGGAVSGDSNGVLRYARIEFAGVQLAPDVSTHALALNGVGAGTAIDHVQALLTNADGFYFSGGTVNAKFLVATGENDDGFDWQLGYTGAIQYAYAAQYGGNLGLATGSHGIEADNSEFNFEASPRSAPRLCNMTLVGAKGQPGAGGVNPSFGALFRRGTAGRIANSIIFNSITAGEQLRDVSTATVACLPGPALTGALNVQNSLLWNNGPGGTTHCLVNSSTAGGNCDSCTLLGLWESQATAPSSTTTDPGFPATTGTVWPPIDPIPGAVTTSTAFDCHALDPSFDTTSYVGAFAPGASSWLTSPWISYNTF